MVTNTEQEIEEIESDFELERELENEIAIESAGLAKNKFLAFSNVYLRKLAASGKIDEVEARDLRALGRNRKKLEILGFTVDDIDNVMSVFIGKYFDEDAKLPKQQAEEIFSRAIGFIEHACDGWFKENVEESSEVAEVALRIKACFRDILLSKIRFILVTNATMSDRIKTLDSSEVCGLRATFEIWDRNRVLASQKQSKGSEDIFIDFQAMGMPKGLPCLVAKASNTKSKASATQTILAVLPAKVLASIFDEYGSLLLESNVRAFLGANKTVNRGIQETLLREPENFLSFNNGLTTTATEVEFVGKGNTHIAKLRHLQIVNGGQTTSSIFHFLRSNITHNVDEVFVQMKLVVVDKKDSEIVVSNIAKYANSQNKVTTSDLFSTHKFHVDMERLSRRVLAPAREGMQYSSGWYYERARGQWENDLSSRRTPKERKSFEMEFPKSQRISKTDWAKIAMCWKMKPHEVSKGSQTAFLGYARIIENDIKREPWIINEYYFKTHVAYAIIYNELHKAVLKADWYKQMPGYLANIVAYAIARFEKEMQEYRYHRGMTLDLLKVWENQSPSAATLDVLLSIAKQAREFLNRNDRKQANVTQWAKQEECWDRFSKEPLKISSTLSREFVENSYLHKAKHAGKENLIRSSEKEDAIRYRNVSEIEWRDIRDHVDILARNAKEKQLVDNFARLNKYPTESQIRVLLELLDRRQGNG